MSKIKKSSSNHKSRITRRIALQYLLALAGFIVAFLFLAYIGYQLTHLVIWQPDDPFYAVIRFVKDYNKLFISLPLIAGWALITYYFMGRSLRYLDEIISASEQLANPTDGQIILSDVMKGVQDELNQVRETALRNARLAKEAEQRKNDLIVYLAHDLKTPLTSVIGYLTLLRDEDKISDELRKKYLSISLNKAERLEELINEFFEITRFSLSNIELQYRRISLTRLLEQLTFEFKPMLMDKALVCNLNCSPDVMIKCDVNKIQRVLDNLLRNAVSYSYENSTIEITVTQNDKQTVIQFANHGDTIPKDKLGQIFEQFYRLDAARSTNNGGAGLGLAIAKEIVELHGGRISAKSQNEFTEFCVELPIL